MFFSSRVLEKSSQPSYRGNKMLLALKRTIIFHLSWLGKVAPHEHLPVRLITS